jgi:hypothetical protein
MRNNLKEIYVETELARFIKQVMRKRLSSTGVVYFCQTTITCSLKSALGSFDKIRESFPRIKIQNFTEALITFLIRFLGISTAFCCCIQVVLHKT